MSHVDPFNALGGFSVGIPPELVIDENGNVVNNVNAPEANVTANRVYANYYYWANGVPFTPNAVAAGTNSQVQFNNNGNFGASPAFIFNSATNLLTVTKLATTSANLGNVANITILGGDNGYFLQTDGAGNLTWAAATGNGGNGTPGGANTQVQFNDSGAFGGDAGFTYNKISNTLTTGNIVADYIILNWDVSANVVFANYLSGDGSNITNVHAIISDVANSVAGSNVTGQVNFAAVANSVAGANVSGQVGFANVANNVAGANVSGQVANALVAGTVYTNAQPNITSVGNLTNLTVTGNANLGNSVTANYFTGNLWGLANTARTVTQAAQPNITSVGTLTTLNVTGNTNLGITNTSNLYAQNFTVSNNFITLGNLVAGNIFANTGNIVANLLTGVLVTAYQPNITTVGTLVTLNVAGNVTSGNIAAGNLVSANYLQGILTTNAQPNINYLGNVGWLNVDTSLPNSNGNITFNGSILGNGDYSNISITGNLDAGNYVQAELLIGTIATSAQPNITSLGPLTNLNVVGTSNLGNVANVKILGGTNGYVLSTDGTGNLSWVVQSGNGGGNGTPGGSNTQLQYNDQGSFGGSAALTWNNTSQFLYVGGNATFQNTVNAASFVSSTVSTGNLNAAGNITAGNVNAGNLLTANYISGTLTTNTQANINYLGNVGWLNVDTAIPNANGNITFNGSISGIGAASNVVITGNVNAGNYVQAELLIGTITTSAQPNITSLGNLSSLNVQGNTNLGNVGNVHILGGNANYVLSTDGTGNLNWVAQAAANATTPGGSNTYIQFNDANTFGGDPDFTWNKNTNRLYVGGNIETTGIVTALSLTSNVATGSPPLTVNSTTPVANLAVQTADTVRSAAQPNITSVGSLTNLTILGNTLTNNLDVQTTFTAANITTPGTTGTTNLNVTGLANFSGNAYINTAAVLYVKGNINASQSPNVNLGNVANLHISGGINGYVLATDGAGNLFWSAGGGGGGNGNPGGSNTQIQYNDSGAFGGSAVFTFDAPNAKVNIGGDLHTNTITMGSGVYEFSHSNVYFATTNNSSEQTILSIPSAGIAAVDYTIISTDGSTRNFIKISAVISGSTLNYVEYSTIPVNGYTGDFAVVYNAGNIITPASIQLKMTPQSANLMTHKMSVTTYKE